MTLLERLDLFMMAAGFYTKARNHENLAVRGGGSDVRGLLQKAPETAALRDAGWRSGLVEHLVEHDAEGYANEGVLRQFAEALGELGAPLLPYFFRCKRDAQGNLEFLEEPAWPLLPTPRRRLSSSNWLSMGDTSAAWFNRRGAAARNRIRTEDLGRRANQKPAADAPPPPQQVMPPRRATKGTASKKRTPKTRERTPQPVEPWDCPDGTMLVIDGPRTWLIWDGGRYRKKHSLPFRSRSRLRVLLELFALGRTYTTQQISNAMIEDGFNGTKPNKIVRDANRLLLPKLQWCPPTKKVPSDIIISRAGAYYCRLPVTYAAKLPDWE